MPKYHVLASKEIKPCNEKSCRAKHGSFESKKEATDFVRTLKSSSKKTSSAKKPVDVTEKETLVEDSQDNVDEPIISEEPVIIEDDVKTEDEIEEEVGQEAEITFEDVEDLINDEPEDTFRNYFEDDEVFLKTQDEVLATNDNSGLFLQAEQTISFEILNFYDDNGRPLSKYALRRNAPILQLNSSSFEYPIEMVLTENFVRVLSKQTTDVYRRYYGLEPRKNAGGKLDEMRTWLENNPAKAVSMGILLTVIILIALVL